MSDIGLLRGRWSGVARGAMHEAVLRRLLRTLRYGRLVCLTPEGRRIEQDGLLPGPSGVLVLRDWKALRALLIGGDIAFAAAYVDGAWDSPDLTALLALAAMNFVDAGTARSSLPWRLMQRLRHAANRNSCRGARRNIMAHYDLGNAFYAQWLDPTMLYSAALYDAPDDDLEVAQERKLALIEDWLGTSPEQSVLEVGCGWGALAARLGAAGAHVTGLTLSPAQRDWSLERIAAEGLDAQVGIALRDYRAETGCYDRIVSVEMLEAVGEAYWPTYFRALRERLRPGGRAVLQVITIEAARFADYCRNPDFIQLHVFPGGMLPTKAAIAAQARAAGLVPGRVRHFGESYARTLVAWRERFSAAWPRIEALGFDVRFRRLWEYYLCYCEAGFRTGSVDVGLYELIG